MYFNSLIVLHSLLVLLLFMVYRTLVLNYQYHGRPGMLVIANELLVVLLRVVVNEIISKTPIVFVKYTS